jgi:hypothetical protein
VSNPKMTGRRIRSYLQPPLISFQMGKVGSSTIKDTIETDYRVHHMHTRQEMELILPHIRRKAGKKIDLITASRDPIGREISVFFQNLIAPGFPYGVSSRKEALHLGASGLIPHFKKMLESGGAETTIWFDRHFKPSTGVDIYEHPFDRDKGWLIIETDEWNILVVRFEDINKNYCEAVNAFVAPRFGKNIRYKKMRPFNVSDDKWYSTLMKEFKSTITFNKEMFESVFNSKYVKHFYTEKEIEKMKSKYRMDV